MAKPIVRSTSVDEAVHMPSKRNLRKSACCRSKGKPESEALPTMQADSKFKRKKSGKQRSLSTGDLQESTNITLEELRCFPELLLDRGSSLYVPLQKLPQTKEKNNVEFEILRQHIESMDKKLGTLLDEVKKIKRTVEKQINPFSKTSRFSSRLGKKTMVWRRREKRRQEQQKCPAKKNVNQCKEENANLCLRFLLMLMNVADETSQDSTMKKTTTLKPVSLAHAMKDSFSRDTLERTIAKATMKDENRETLLDSFMYRDYHNGFPAAATTAELHPLIVSSRNIDEYVSRELHSSLPTPHSDGASGSTSNESRSSEGPHSMNLELIRLGTFKNFPPSGAVSTIKLAKEGFYYSGNDDRVICFACGFEKSGWKVNDDPREIHRQGSPECSFINAQSVNVRVGESLNSQNGSQEHENSEEVSQQNATDFLSTENETQSQGTEQVPSSENLSALSSPERDHLPLPCNRNVDSSPVQRNLGPEPQATPSTPQDRRNEQEHSQAQSNTIHNRARNTQEKINAFLRNLDPLGINFDRPKYPAYAVLATRISSFQGWPASLTQQPRDLGTAGFFYVGYGDYTRCFFCGGGLRNWEPGDDPWTEHARWFPKCAFVRQNKGDEFVALVQIKHQELEELEAMASRSNASAAEKNTEVPNGDVHFDISTLPSFQSVQEMGYSVESIKEAFRELKGTKNLEDITGMDIMNVILQKEDRNNGLDIPPQTNDVTRQSSHEIQSRNLNDSQNHSGTPDTNHTEVTGAALTSLPSANDKDEEEKEQEKDKSVAASKSEEKLDSLNNALMPMSLEDTRSLLEENRQLRELRMCKICMENEASIAMLPCGHLCCCTDCAPAMRKCPICRQFVKGTVRTWLA